MVQFKGLCQPYPKWQPCQSQPTGQLYLATILDRAELQTSSLCSPPPPNQMFGQIEELYDAPKLTSFGHINMPGISFNYLYLLKTKGGGLWDTKYHRILCLNKNKNTYIKKTTTLLQKIFEQTIKSGSGGQDYECKVISRSKLITLLK